MPDCQYVSASGKGKKKDYLSLPGEERRGEKKVRKGKKGKGNSCVPILCRQKKRASSYRTEKEGREGINAEAIIKRRKKQNLLSLPSSRQREKRKKLLRLPSLIGRREEKKKKGLGKSRQEKKCRRRRASAPDGAIYLQSHRKEGGVQGGYDEKKRTRVLSVISRSSSHSS